MVFCCHYLKCRTSLFMEVYVAFPIKLCTKKNETTVLKMICFSNLPSLRLQNDRGSHFATAYRTAFLSLSSYHHVLTTAVCCCSLEVYIFRSKLIALHIFHFLDILDVAVTCSLQSVRTGDECRVSLNVYG
jgi:hypothetical protein